MLMIVKMAADQEVKKKKERDPILTVGFVVLLLAFASVIGIFINDEYLSSSESTPAKTGDLVYVDYTGSYYTYYDETGAVIFDTSLWSVADNSDLKKSFEFSKRTESQYVPLSFTIGGTDNLLQRFKDAAVGLMPGESSTVRISPEDGYGALTTSNTRKIDNTTLTKNVTEQMTKSDFEAFYGITGLSGSVSRQPSPYGWTIDAVCPTGSNIVTVTHNIRNAVYTLNDDVDIEVTDVTAGVFTYKYIINDLKYAPAEDQTVPESLGYGAMKSVKLVKIIYNEKNYFLAAVGADNAEMFVLKNSDSNNRETVGMYLYFTVTRV